MDSGWCSEGRREREGEAVTVPPMRPCTALDSRLRDESESEPISWPRWTSSCCDAGAERSSHPPRSVSEQSAWEAHDENSLRQKQDTKKHRFIEEHRLDSTVPLPWTGRFAAC